MVGLPRKREPGFQKHFDDGEVLPIIVPPSHEPTVIRISRARNGATNINAPKHVEFLKRDKRPGKHQK